LSIATFTDLQIRTAQIVKCDIACITLTMHQCAAE